MPRDTPEEIRERDEHYRSHAQDHVARYVASGGTDGYDDNALKVPTLILYTTGRRSGREVATPIYYAESEGRYVVIASYAGADAHPKWYLNLAENPNVEVQVRDKRFAAVARTAEGNEREALWSLLADAYAFYREYADATDRLIPVVVLEPKKV